MERKSKKESSAEKFENNQDEIPLIPILHGKVEVDDNEIRFKHFLYTVVIPKQTAIYYKFYDPRRTLGLLALNVKADNMEIRTSMGIFGRIFYIGALLNEKFAASNECMSPTTVYSVKEIKNFLYALKSNDYQVDSELAQLQPLIYDYIPPRRGLAHKATFGCLFIWGYFTLAWFIPLIIERFFPGWGLASFIILIICFPILIRVTKFQNKRTSNKNKS